MIHKPNIETALRFLDNFGPQKPLLCAITGSHIYGFASGNSDLDIKGIHQVQTSQILGLNSNNETIDKIVEFEQIECDLTSNEISQALRLLINGNGNMLERIFSPIQLINSPEYEKIKQLAQGALSKKFLRHYIGFFKGCCRDHERAKQHYAKSMLYSYRVALTGVHLLMNQSVECDLNILAEIYGFEEIKYLIELKTNTIEKAILDEDTDQLFREKWRDLSKLLYLAEENSSLPEFSTNQAECNDWLISIRKDNLLST